MIAQQDVTRAHRMERRLQKALVREKAVVETQRLFLSVTSHDFRTPLTIIDGAARRIGRMAGADSPIAERAAAIRATARRMAQAIDRTLGWSSIAEGKVAFHPELADIGPMVEKAVANQRTLHRDRTFSVELGELPALLLDAGLVERSLDNLLSNAVKYSPAGAGVDVRCVRRGKRVELSVSDHGIGVPEADMRRMFTRFFRAGNTRGTKGTGIGLNAVKFYMGLHGGKVALRSVEGEGSTFTLSFPVK
jgi:signal transduction histidine kinase